MNGPSPERIAPSLAEYDALPYDCLPLAQTHPARLAAVARLFGLAPPAVETCAVLELGCGNGNNLIPMAAALPRARFVGVDLSTRQIAEGRALIADAGLSNIELRHADIASIDRRDGLFDYVIAHGVYSWVPSRVRDRLLAICRANLSPDGVAYVSYNTLPGWSTNGMIRDMMLYQARGIDDPAARLDAGRELVDFLARSIPESAHGTLAREEIGFLQKQPDQYLAHDHLGEINDPVYFHQFIEHAGRHHLQYLSEAELSMMGLGGLAPETVGAMRKLAGNLIAFEQLTDILRHRAFRQTLLVHQSAKISRRIGGHSIAPFAIASPVTVEAPSRVSPTDQTVFVARNGNRFGVSHPLTRAALLHLIERWPESISFDALHEAASRALAGLPVASSMDHAGRVDAAAPQSASGRDALAAELMQLCVAGIADFRLWDPGVTARVPERPMASRLARLQARRADEVTTPLHHPLRLDAFERALVPLLDGTRDLEALSAALVVEQADRAPAAPRAANGGAMPATIRGALQRLARAGLLTKGPWSAHVVAIVTTTWTAFTLLMGMEFEFA